MHVKKGKFRFYPKLGKTILSEGSWEIYDFPEKGNVYKREGRCGVFGETKIPELWKGKVTNTSIERFEEYNVPESACEVSGEQNVTE